MNSPASRLAEKQEPAKVEILHEASPRPLLTPALDTLMIGGASILIFALVYLCMDKSSSIDQISWTAFYLAFAINNPHFMASYQLLYWDRRSEILGSKRLVWAAIIAPVLLLAYLVACVAYGSPRFLGYAVNFMYFTVGWHYIKQIYGAMVVSSARRAYFFSAREALIVKAALYPLWFLSFLSANTGVRQLMQYGVGYQTFALPTWLLPINYALLVASVLALAWMFYAKWLREGKLPGLSTLASLAAIYVWYLPSLYHAIFWYLIPCFHSLQYMLFVISLKKNQALEGAAAYSQDPPQQRAYFARSFLGFMCWTIVLAYVSFKLLPEALDAWVAYDRQLFGPQLFMFSFITFINIHHYFIDNVIWRRDNPALKRYLL